MTLKPGSSETEAAFADSMAEEIENALKMEWLAIKKEPFPELGRSARRIFLSAIAQGILNHLKNHNSDIISMPIGSQIFVRSPHIELHPSAGNANQMNVLGSFFPGGSNVTVVWDDSAKAQSIVVQNDGSFALSLNIPQEAKSGRHVIEARDGFGNVALAVYERA